MILEVINESLRCCIVSCYCKTNTLKLSNLKYQIYYLILSEGLESQHGLFGDFTAKSLVRMQSVGAWGCDLKGSMTQAGSASKPIHILAGKIQFFAGCWAEDLAPY